MPGFEPAPGITGRLSDRVSDPARRELLEQIQITRHSAEDAELSRLWNELEKADVRDQAGAQSLLRQKSVVEFMQRRELEEGEAALRRQTAVAGRVGAHERLRDHGRTDAARTLALKVRRLGAARLAARTRAHARAGGRDLALGGR